MIFVAAVMLLVASTLHAAFTNPEANIRWNRANIVRENGPLDIWLSEAEDYLDGTSALPDRLRFGEISAPSGNPSSNTGWLYVKDAAGTSTLYFEDDAGVVTALGASTFAGGSVTDDIVMANAQYLRSTTTNAEASAIQVYDTDTGPAYTNVLSFTNGTAPAIVLGADTSTLAVNASAITVGTSAVAKTITIGNETGASALNLKAGTGNIDIQGVAATTITIGDAAQTGAITIGASTATMTDLSLGTGVGAHTIHIGDGGTAAQTVTIGSTSSTSAVTVQAGTGDLALTSVDDVTLNGGSSGSLINIGTNTHGNVFHIGDDDTTADSGTIGSAKDTWALAGISVTVGSTGTTSATVIQSGSGGVGLNVSNNQPTNIGTGTTTGTVTIGGSAAQTIAIGNGAAAKTVTLGSTNTTSTTTINAGSGGVAVVGNVAGNGAGTMAGFLRTIDNDSDGKSAGQITVAMSGGILTNLGASGSYAWTLPEAAAGLTYTFVVMAAQELRVTPDAGDKINHAGTAAANGEYYWADAVGESVTIVAIDSATWVVLSQTGTWSEQTP